MTVFAAALAWAVGAGASVSFGSVPDDGVLAFDIVRNGKPIGTHVYRFQRDEDRLEVDIRTNIDYRLLSIPFYRFEHRSHEVWRDGRIGSVTSRTNDNGTPIELSVAAEAGSLRIAGRRDEEPVDGELAAAGTAPDSLWNRDTLDAVRLFSTVGGKPMRIAVQDLGSALYPVAGQQVPARHFRITGEYERELWYSDAGVLIGVRFTASDGSTVQYVPRQNPS
ncbi:MAG: DUF6134 family protein [Alphaproteobacteria bacterium]